MSKKKKNACPSSSPDNKRLCFKTSEGFKFTVSTSRARELGLIATKKPTGRCPDWREGMSFSTRYPHN